MSATADKASRDGYALAYREARMGLEDQERAVVELRARAGALIAAAAITTSFFGGQTLVKQHQRCGVDCHRLLCVARLYGVAGVVAASGLGVLIGTRSVHRHIP